MEADCQKGQKGQKRQGYVDAASAMPLAMLAATAMRAVRTVAALMDLALVASGDGRAHHLMPHHLMPHHLMPLAMLQAMATPTPSTGCQYRSAGMWSQRCQFASS